MNPTNSKVLFGILRGSDSDGPIMKAAANVSAEFQVGCEANPVAIWGVNAAKNAGLIAIQVLETSDERLAKAYVGFKEMLTNESPAKNQTLTKSLNA